MVSRRWSHRVPYGDNQPMVRAAGLVKKFGGLTAVDGISFEVHRGETLGILGQSGSGKSVTLKLLVGLLKPDRGYVVFEGKDLAHMTERDLLELRKRVSYVFQGGAVFDFLDVRENIAYPLREMGTMDETMIQDRVEYLLQAVGMEDQDARDR